MFRGRDNSPLYFELLVSTGLNKPIAPIIVLYPISERGGLLKGSNRAVTTCRLPLQESEEESGDVPGLSALLSACTSMDAYSVVSVRDFFI